MRILPQHSPRVTKALKIEFAEPAGALRERAFWSGAAGLVFLAYFAVFLAAGRGDPLSSALASVRNLVTLLPLAWAAASLVKRLILPRRLLAQLFLHALFSLVFTLSWYWLLMVAIGLSEGASPLRFSVEPFFPSSAAAWQLLQGLAVYGFLAATVYARARPDLPRIHVREEQAGPEKEESRQASGRYFIRAGEDIRPVDFDEIIAITGADDYAEVTTTAGRHLVRMTLAEFEAALDPGRFLRIHRSAIVNVERIERAEAAGGGRMLLHMVNGETVQASRAGTRLLRGRVL